MKLGFRFRIMIAIIAVAVVCVASVVFVSYNESKQEIEQNYVAVLDEKLTLQAERFDETMRDLYLAVQKVGHSKELKACIAEYLESERTYADSLVITRALKAMLSYEQLGSALWLHLPETDQMFSSLEYYPVQDLDELYLVTWTSKADSPYVPLFYMNWFARSSQYVYAYARPIYDDDGNVLATVCITVDERKMYYDLLDSLNSSKSESYMILNTDGTIASANQISLTRKRLDDVQREQTDRMHAEIGADGMLYTSVKAPFSEYRLSCRSDLSVLTDNLRSHIFVLMAFVFTVLFLMVVVAVIVSNKLCQPVGELVDAMDRVKEGDFTIRVSERATDEFGAVVSHFNELMSRMDKLAEEVAQERTQKMEAEINALQYQIRPHFMYNTLNSIRFAATMQGNQKLADLLDDYIALLEASVQRKGAFLTLRDEIGLVKNYLSLQSFRYSDCFETVFRIASDVEDCYVPCLLLQPLVENAVFHGIDPKRNDNRLEILAWKEEDQLMLSVRDNGSGFVTDVDEQEEGKRRLTGIGLRNVEQRLHLYYGEHAYFTISSQPGGGTMVDLCLPASYDPEEYSVRKGGKQDEA